MDEKSQKPRRGFRLRWLLGLLLVFICTSPFWLYYYFALQGTLDRRYVESLMPIYPNSQRIFEDFSFETANSGEQFIYYWTPDDSAAVFAYFEQLDHVLTGDEGDYFTFGTYLPLEDYPTYDRNYSCIYRCIGGIGIRQEADSVVHLPSMDALRIEYIHSRYDDAMLEPTPRPTAFRGGTLLIYYYDTPEM